MYSLNEVKKLGLKMLLNCHRLSNENFNTTHKKSSLELLVNTILPLVASQRLKVSY